MTLIQWYPGHINKAERQLKEQLKNVDIVLEVRDARIPLASHHPQLNSWIGEKPRILVLNREDMIRGCVRNGMIGLNLGEKLLFLPTPKTEKELRQFSKPLNPQDLPLMNVEEIEGCYLAPCARW